MECGNAGVPGVLLAVDRVGKTYRYPGGTETVEVLRDVTLQVASGESVAILGPSGSGKSTLLNLAGALDRPTSGRVVLDGEDLAEMDDARLTALRNRRIGFVFQLHHLLPHLTCLETVLVPALAGGAAGGEVCARARELLARVGLSARESYMPGQLSGGERQRAAVVRALINRPVILLADEPTGALDRASAGALADLLLELNRDDGLTMLVVTHAEDLAARMGRVVELRDGRLAAWERRP